MNEYIFTAIDITNYVRQEKSQEITCVDAIDQVVHFKYFSRGNIHINHSGLGLLSMKLLLFWLLLTMLLLLSLVARLSNFQVLLISSCQMSSSESRRRLVADCIVKYSHLM